MRHGSLDSLVGSTVASGYQDTGRMEGAPKWKQKGASEKGVSQHVQAHHDNLHPFQREKFLPEYMGPGGEQPGGTWGRKPKFQMPSSIFSGAGNDPKMGNPC